MIIKIYNKWTKNDCNSYNKDELIFEGEYLNGKRNGNGKEYDKYDILIFEGEYLYNQKKKENIILIID